METAPDGWRNWSATTWIMINRISISEYLTRCPWGLGAIEISDHEELEIEPDGRRTWPATMGIMINNHPVSEYLTR